MDYTNGEATQKPMMVKTLRAGEDRTGQAKRFLRAGISQISPADSCSPNERGLLWVHLRLNTLRGLGKKERDQVQKVFRSPDIEDSRRTHQEVMSESASWWKKGLWRGLGNPGLMGEGHQNQAGLRESRASYRDDHIYDTLCGDRGGSCELWS